MIESIHQSMLGMAGRCGEQFRRRYVEDEISPPGIAAGRGTAVHKANEINLRNKIDTGEDQPLSVLLDAARDGFNKAFEYGIHLTKADRPAEKQILNEGLNDAIALTKLYLHEVAPELKPLEVEYSFNVPVEGIEYPLAGRFDMTDEHGIGDLKTSGKSWPEGRIKKEIQSVFYSLVYRLLNGTSGNFRYYILRKTKTKADAQYQEMTAGYEDFRALIARIQAFCKSIKAGTFQPADRSHWVCDEKWCGYYWDCKYV